MQGAGGRTPRPARIPMNDGASLVSDGESVVFAPGMLALGADGTLEDA